MPMNFRYFLQVYSCLFVFAFIGTASLFGASDPAISVERDSMGLVMHNGNETLRVSVCGENLLHIVAGPHNPKAGSPVEPWLIQGCTQHPFQIDRTNSQVTLRTSQLQFSIDLASGQIAFKNAKGESLLAESSHLPRHYVLDVINGEKVYHVSERFQPTPTEGFYGLGQHQSGVFNYRGSVIELAQANTNVALPLLISTNGYGILWNTASKSWFDNRFPTELKLSAEAADAIDYFFLYGPQVDQVIHEYRELTGHAPLFGKWAYGFVQSKDRYKSAKDLLDIAAEYRSHQVPLDFLVQDWFWWKRQGDPEYSESYLKPDPDVPGAIKQLHEEHLHAMISVWAVTDADSQTYKDLEAHHFIIPGTTDYDPTNPAARDRYWELLPGKLFAQGWDGFWLDSSEPECCGGQSDAVLEDKWLAIGNGARFTNIFPLMHTGNIYDHWRATTDRKRVFILTRSAFAGQQRYATTVWSGDVMGTFFDFRKQIAAGLNFELSGMPYWTTDIAGYGFPYERDTRDPSYQELYARWFEFGVFCPIFRTHGHRINDTNEIFSYGPIVPTLIQYDKLRYRLLPYIYSLAWRITSEDYTLMRPLVMDWRDDPRVREIGDEFLFGPDILVSPVTEEGATSRSIYLPKAEAWYNFWTGQRLSGEQRIVAQAPLDRIPLYIKAGSILPLGPEVQYAEESTDKPVELRVYPGADADFNLYEDEGDTYDYEKGQYAIIPLHWDDASETLTIGRRRGEYPSMPSIRKFTVVLVRSGHGVGPQVTAEADKSIRYDGSSVTCVLKK